MSGIFSIGTRAMFAAQAQINTTASNIANANTPGYSRQTVQLATAGGQFTGAGYFGKGVSVTTVKREHDIFLTREAALARSVAARDQAQFAQLSRLENVFGIGAEGIGHAIGQVLNGFVDVANLPSDTSARQVVLSRTEELVQRFRTAASQLDSIRQGVGQELHVAVDQINSLARSIASLNQQIARVVGLGHEPNDLLDQRDRAISELSEYIQVTQVPASDGTVGIFIGGGQRLVLGDSALQLKVLAGEYDPLQLRVGLLEGNSVRVLPDSSLAGGTVAGLLSFQNDDLVDATHLINRLALSFAQQVNAQQRLGYDQSGQLGSPLLSLAAPGYQTPKGANGQELNTGNATLAVRVDDASALAASDYELRYEGGSWQMRRLSDGQGVPLSFDGVDTWSTPDGLSFTLTGGAPAEHDRFLLQPLRQAAQTMTRLIDDPADLAVASRVVAAVDGGNAGTLGISKLTTVSDAYGLENDIVIEFTGGDAASGYTFNITGTVAFPVPPAAPPSSVVPGQAIRINGWELVVIGSPQPGDRITVGSAPASPSFANDNGNALVFVAMRDEAMIGRVPKVPAETNPYTGRPVLAGGETFTDAYASAMADVGVRVQRARVLAEMSASVADSAQQAVASVSGVNLDEEAARLIQFQQSYQAAAKVLQIAQTVFETLLQTAAR